MRFCPQQVGSRRAAVARTHRHRRRAVAFEPREKRMLMVREDMWLLTADEERSLVHDGTNQGDEDEDDLVIV